MIQINKRDWWTIPNILSYIRIILIPIFMYIYLNAENIRDYHLAALVIALSGLTDFLDGKIARHFNMITELGKLLDPIADKLTQGALVICLSSRFRLMCALVVLFIVKESYMAIMGLIFLKKGKKIDGALWYGKVSTFVFYVVMVILLIYPNISKHIANILIVISGFFLTFAFIMYALVYHNMRTER